MDMNNHINPDRLALAREWAETTRLAEAPVQAHAAADVIAALPDEIIDADKLRKVISAYYSQNEGDHLKSDLEALLPAPKPRTLADMSREGREACQWMQADWTSFDGRQSERVIVVEGYGQIITRNAEVYKASPGSVTPRPDLPRMVWPSAEPVTESNESSDVSSEPLDPVDAQDLAGIPVDDVPPRTVQDLVHHFEGRAESERAAGDTHVGDVWQQAADTLWDTLGGEPAPLPEPQDCETGEAWLVKFNGRIAIGIKNTGGIGPWTIQNPGDCEAFYAENNDVEILARLTPDRSVEK